MCLLSLGGCCLVWSSLQPEGLLGQLHAANVLGSLQVMIEAAVADVSRLVEQQPDANLRVSTSGWQSV